MNLFVIAFLVAAAGDPETEPPPVLLEMPAAPTTADPATTTTTTPPTTTTTTTTAAAPSAPAIDDVAPRALPVLSEDEAGNAAYKACLRTARVDTPAALRACFERVATTHPDTLAAVRARANVTLLDAEHDVTAGEADRSWLPPGRLELVGVAGLFGVWNAIAGGVIVASNSSGSNAGGLLIGVSAASLALGVGFGIGGAAIGEALQLDEGASRMVASGIVWGTNIGIGLLPVVFDLTSANDNVAFPILTVVGAGWVGGLGTLALTNVLKLDTPAVSMVNSGGIWGSVIGVLVMINLAEAQVEPAAAYSATYIGGNVVGLVGGALLSQIVDVSWGETLIFDLGAVIGGSVLGLGVSGAVVSRGGTEGVVPVVTGAVGLGVLGGYTLGMMTLGLLREDAKPLLRSFAGVKPTTPKPVAVFDSAGQPVVMQTLAFAF